MKIILMNIVLVVLTIIVISIAAKLLSIIIILLSMMPNTIKYIFCWVLTSLLVFREFK